METCVIAVEENQNDTAKEAHSCFDRTFSSMTVDDVYEIAKVVGAEVEKLIDSYGKSSVEGLVSRIVKVLELLESFAARNQSHKCKEEELLKAFETLQLQQQKKRHVKECEESSSSAESRGLHGGMNRQLIQQVFTQRMPFQPQPISGKHPDTHSHTHTNTLRTI